MRSLLDLIRFWLKFTLHGRSQIAVRGASFIEAACGEAGEQQDIVENGSAREFVDSVLDGENGGKGNQIGDAREGAGESFEEAVGGGKIQSIASAKDKLKRRI